MTKQPQITSENPIWTQSPICWLAYHPDHAQSIKSPLAGPDDPDVLYLCNHLLSLAGSWVAVPMDDMGSCATILKSGHVIRPNAVARKKGRLNRCHDNAAAFWQADPDRFYLATGYALSRSCWRRHTWLMGADNRLVETTLPQELYFGVLLDNDQAEAFCGGDDRWCVAAADAAQVLAN